MGRQTSDGPAAPTHSGTIEGVSRWAVGRVLAWFLVLAATVGPARGQGAVRVDGTVMWLSGQTLTLRSDIPSAPGYQIIGQYAVPVPGPPLTVTCDLRQLAQSDYAFMRPGERLSVIGVMSSDGRRLEATSIIRGAEAQAP
jgi:hypothetical protein